MDHEPKVLVTNGNHVQDITEFCKVLTWSGSEKSTARTFGFSILDPEKDKHLPQIVCGKGSPIDFQIDGDSAFVGTVFKRGSDTLGVAIDFTACDWGVNLKRNSDFVQVKNQTPEAVTRQLASRLGCEVGTIATTGVKLNQNFMPGTFYEIIEKLYELASGTTGKSYCIRFAGRKLNVVEEVQNSTSLLLVPGSNLLYCRTQSSAMNLVNAVNIYDDKDQLIKTANGSTAAVYGVFQTAIRASSYDDPDAAAAKLLEDGKEDLTLTCDCLGHPFLITGNTVVVNDPESGQYGLFKIVSDAHEWQRGTYRTKVVISFDRFIDASRAEQAIKLQEGLPWMN